MKRLIIVMMCMVVTAADPVCIVPEGHTDPEEIIEDNSPQGYQVPE